MRNVSPYEFWFVVGSQELYGSDAVVEVEKHAEKISDNLNRHTVSPFRITLKAVVTSSNSIRQVCKDANSDDDCAGVITWMHTFSPAKMWIEGLAHLRKPLLHLHTQFNRAIPWNSIDMDFMNLNQSAHGDREFGFIASRMGVKRKVITGHWEDSTVRQRVNDWMKTAAAAAEGRQLKVARFGDNMRDVAVTEGNKVNAQIQFGWSVNGYGVGDVAASINSISGNAVDELVSEYEKIYEIPDELRSHTERWNAVREQARIELGIRAFLEQGNFLAFTTTFEDLHGIRQLPGLAAQRLMADGYGFGAEGDWKTAALLRVMKVMAGFEDTSFMEDYTYHFEPGNEMVLGAHMLEVCPTITNDKPRVEVHPLSIGGKEDPARLIFDGKPGHAVCASLIDLGHRYRLVINEVDAVELTHDLPNLPVARVLWHPQPSLQTAAEAWIYAGGAHHTVFSYKVTVEQLVDWAEIVGIEYVLINKDTSLLGIKNELRWSDAAWAMK